MFLQKCFRQASGQLLRSGFRCTFFVSTKVTSLQSRFFALLTIFVWARQVSWCYQNKDRQFSRIVASCGVCVTTIGTCGDFPTKRETIIQSESIVRSCDRIVTYSMSPCNNFRSEGRLGVLFCLRSSPSEVDCLFSCTVLASEGLWPLKVLVVALKSCKGNWRLAFKYDPACRKAGCFGLLWKVLRVIIATGVVPGERPSLTLLRSPTFSEKFISVGPKAQKESLL